MRCFTTAVQNVFAEMISVGNGNENDIVGMRILWEFLFSCDFHSRRNPVRIAKLSGS